MSINPEMLTVSRREYQLLHAIAYGTSFIVGGGPLARIHADILPKKLAELDAIHEGRMQRIAADERATAQAVA